jgi:hypothetical protein
MKESFLVSGGNQGRNGLIEVIRIAARIWSSLDQRIGRRPNRLMVDETADSTMIRPPGR